MQEELDWNVAVFCMNEEARLEGCLTSVTAALSGRQSLISVILNGSRDRSRDIACGFVRAGHPVEVFEINAADKSNAINQFFHRLRSPARCYGGVDGYAHVGLQSFQAMQDRLSQNTHAVAVTGVCTNGRTMRLATEATLTVGGRLHGQLHAFRRSFLDRMVARGIKLPLGTYWGDGLLGSMAAHDLDPLSQPWDNARISGVAEATYEIPQASLLSPDDIRRHFRRRVRQMRGRIQNAAIKDVISKAGYEGLPDDADDMVASYVGAHGLPRVGWPDRFFQHLAMRQGRAAARDPASLVPRRVPPS